MMGSLKENIKISYALIWRWWWLPWRNYL